MSIEALIKAHTEALLANTEAVKLLTLSLAGRTPAKSEVTPAVEKPKKEPIDARELTDPALQRQLIDEQEPDVKKPELDYSDVEITGVPYETVRALVLKLAPTQRDAIKALNAKHGIANLKVLLDKEDDFSTVNDQAKLEAVYTDLQALEA